MTPASPALPIAPHQALAGRTVYDRAGRAYEVQGGYRPRADGLIPVARKVEVNRKLDEGSGVVGAVEYRRTDSLYTDRAEALAAAPQLRPRRQPAPRLTRRQRKARRRGHAKADRK